MAPCSQSLLARPMAAPREQGWGRLEVPGAPAPRPRPAPSPFQRRDAFVPAGGPPSGEAGSGLPRAIPVPGLLLPLPPALGVPAIVRRCPRGERGDLKAVIKDAEGKLPVPLRQREEVLVHVLRGEGHDRGPRRGPQAPPTPPPPQAQDSKGAGAQEGSSGAPGSGGQPVHWGRGHGRRRLTSKGCRLWSEGAVEGAEPFSALLEGPRTGPVSAPPPRPLQPRPPPPSTRDSRPPPEPSPATATQAPLRRCSTRPRRPDPVAA